jgi:hypothetical protein
MPKSKASTRKKSGKSWKADQSQKWIAWCILNVAVITALCLFPLLRNGFTNWDDHYYVPTNSLLRGPDWIGIFTRPVVSNYHPLTVLSLAANFAISGTDPRSYLLFNLLLHLANTVLVFWFAYLVLRTVDGFNMNALKNNGHAARPRPSQSLRQLSCPWVRILSELR